MADTKLSDLTELAATPASNDEVYIRDVSEVAAQESKRITIANLQALLLPLAGGTMTGPLIIDDATYIQMGDSAGSAQLLPHLEATVGGVLIKPSAGNRMGYLALFPKGTVDRTQISMYNRDQNTDTSVFNIEVNGDTVNILYEDIGTPLTSISRIRLVSPIETAHVIPFIDRLSKLGNSTNRYSDVYAQHHNIIQALPSDHEASGIVAPMTAGTPLTRGQAVYVGGDSKMEKALATGTSTMPAIALVVYPTISENAEGDFLMQGFMRDDTWNWTIGGSLYISKDTAGDLTQTSPATIGEQVQVVGVAITADIIHFNPSLAIEEIS